MLDLDCYAAYGPEGGFNEVGHTFMAWQPRGATARPIAVVQAFRDGTLIREVEVPLRFEYGEELDPCDALAVNSAMDALVGELTPAEEGARR